MPTAATLNVPHTNSPRSFFAWLNPVAMTRNLWSHRGLVRQYAAREFRARYRGQRLGLMWAVVTPLVMLAIYTFIFGVVFKAKWGEQSGATMGEAALQIFAGLLVFGVFREVVGHSPGLVLHQPQFVKRVVFPLEILPLCTMMNALVVLAIGSGVWLVGFAFIERTVPPLTILLVPVLVTPVCLLALGLAWTLAAIGVFLRDISNMVELSITALFFLTPVFYSIERIPEPYRAIIGLNPIATVIESVRTAAIAGSVPDMTWFLPAAAASCACAIFGYAVFMKARRAFADVV